MKKEVQDQQVCPAFRQLYPTLTETELRQAEKNFRRYLEIAAEIQEEQEVGSRAFDSVSDPTTMRERSNSLKS